MTKISLFTYMGVAVSDETLEVQNVFCILFMFILLIVFVLAKSGFDLFHLLLQRVPVDCFTTQNIYHFTNYVFQWVLFSLHSASQFETWY